MIAKRKPKQCTVRLGNGDSHGCLSPFCPGIGNRQPSQPSKAGTNRAITAPQAHQCSACILGLVIIQHLEMSSSMATAKRLCKQPVSHTTSQIPPPSPSPNKLSGTPDFCIAKKYGIRYTFHILPIFWTAFMPQNNGSFCEMPVHVYNTVLFLFATSLLE